MNQVGDSLPPVDPKKKSCVNYILVYLNNSRKVQVELTHKKLNIRGDRIYELNIQSF